MATTRSTARKAALGIALNLDTATRPEEEVKEPFVAVVGGKRLTFTDAADIDWEVLASLDNPHDFVQHCLSEDDAEHFYAQKLPGWKFRELWDAYRVYYGLKKPGQD